MIEKVITTLKVPIIDLDETTRRRLGQIINRDTRVIDKSLNIIDMYEDQLLKVTKRKNGRIKYNIDHSKLCDLTLTTKDRVKVPHDFKKMFPRISLNEIVDAQRTAIGMWVAYLQSKELGLNANRPRVVKNNIPRYIHNRRFKLHLEEKTLEITDSLDTNPKKLRLGLNKIYHDWRTLHLDLRDFHINKLSELELRSVSIHYFKGVFTALLALGNDVDQLTYEPVKPRKEIALVGIDLGIRRDAFLAVISDRGVIDQRAITNEHIKSTKANLDKLSKRYSALQKHAQRERNKGRRSDGKFKLLREIRDHRQSLKLEICNQLSAEIVKYIQHLELDLNLDVYIVLGKLKGIRDSHNKGNGKKQLRKLIHSWSYGTLTSMLQYKLANIGYSKRLLIKKESYTSKRCWKCGTRGQRVTQTKFYCSYDGCYWRGNADLNGAINIAKRGMNYFKLTKFFKNFVGVQASLGKSSKRARSSSTRTTGQVIVLKARKPVSNDPVADTGEEQPDVPTSVEAESNPLESFFGT